MAGERFGLVHVRLKRRVCLGREGTHAVLQSYGNESLIVGIDDLGHVVGAIAEAVSALVDVDQHRQVGRVGRRIHVEVEAVLVAGDVGSVGDRGIRLRADGAKALSVRDGRNQVERLELRRLPSQVACGRGRVTDSATRELLVSSGGGEGRLEMCSDPFQ